MKANPISLKLSNGSSFAFGRNLPCPQCKTIGFYGPRKDPIDNPTRKYRACKFCGFWQDIWGKNIEKTGGKPYQCIMVICKNCQTYDWRADWAFYLGSCPKCHATMEKAQWPSKNPNHPYCKIRDEIIKFLQAQ